MKNPLLPACLALAMLPVASAAQVTLQNGQTAVLGDQKIIVLSVQDSRCPAGTQCIRAGELKAKLLVSRANKLRLLTLQFPAQPNASWEGLRIVAASAKTTGKQAALKLTFSDQRE